tara:strand:- start:6 stop:494 length:489 start_codon:yes stop_codon:yes gene_type:complete
MLAHFEAEAERLRNAIAGKPDTASESGVLKSLKRRLRKTQTELRAANLTINGQTNTEGGVMRKPIADTIEATKARVASQIETRDRANEFQARLPMDVERLEALIASAEQGDTVEFPSDLTRLSDDQDKTTEQHEASAVITQADDKAAQNEIDAVKRKNGTFA